MDVTTTVERQLDGHIPNHGFVIKHTNVNEQNTTKQFGSVKFFSRDTHTIYVPRLEVGFDDSSFDTGNKFNKELFICILILLILKYKSILCF